MAYEVRTDVFEGPFDVLLRLIAAQEVDVYEISLAAIVDAFCAEVAAMAALDLEVATEFAVIAATLVELKSRRLLPVEERTPDDEDLLLLEERDLLLARLVECRTFQSVAAHISALAHTAARSHARRAGPEDVYRSILPDLLAGVTPDDLGTALARAWSSKPPAPRVDLSHVTPVPRISVDDAITMLAERVRAEGRARFRELCRDLSARIDVVVHFLALLELYKQGLVDLDQAATFGELVVTWTGDAGGGIGEVDEGVPWAALVAAGSVAPAAGAWEEAE